MNWKQRLEQLMAEKAWTQYDLATASGYAQSNINRLLKLTEPPSPKVQAKIAKAFDITVESLLGQQQPFISVPVLAKSQINLWLDGLSCDIAEWMPSPINKSRLFAFRLNASDSQADCPSGSIVIIDPGSDLLTNHKILCRLNDGRTLVRQLTEASDSWFLTALQTGLPAIEVGNAQNFTYLGTVISTLIIEKNS